MDSRGADDVTGTLLFSLLLDKTLPSLVEIAAWNPGKDLLAMVTKDHQLVVHRLNWQRLWAVTPDLKVTAICWRPDGKALAVGHTNGSIAIHDVENGDVLRKTQTHQVSVQCLYWTEESQSSRGDEENVFIYEDRTSRFFPPPPKPPPMPGAAPSFDMSIVLGPNMEDLEGSSLKGATRDVKHRLDILCSGDKDGFICLSAFGVFPIGKLDVREIAVKDLRLKNDSEKSRAWQLLNTCALQVSLSNDLRHMTIICSGTSTAGSTLDPGIYCISVDTALLNDRRKEIRQVALQVSSIEELVDVLQTSLTVMEKHWSEAIGSLKEKFSRFSKLLGEHGSNATHQDELLGLLTSGYASPALLQFLAASLGEGGLKRLAKSVDAAGRELHNAISEHMQPAAEIIAFRLGELRGLSRWQARLGCVGLQEPLMDSALEHAGMLLVQLERLVHVISDTTGGYRLFFMWLLKALRQLNREALPQSEQLPTIDCMALASFLQTDFEKDPVGLHLSNASDIALQVPRELMVMMEEVAIIGGYKDSNFLQRTLAQEVHRLSICCQEAFTMPLKVMSMRLGPPRVMLLHHVRGSRSQLSLMYFEVKQDNGPLLEPKDRLPLAEYICFQMDSGSQLADRSVVGILRGFGQENEARAGNIKTVPEAITLQLDERLQCIDLALYKKRQLLLLVTQRDQDRGGAGQSSLMLLPLDTLPFRQLVPTSSPLDLLHLCSLNGSVTDISLRDGKVRDLPQSDVVTPLAVSASRGLACVFTSQRRVLLFDLEEDEEVKDDDLD